MVITKSDNYAKWAMCKTCVCHLDRGSPQKTCQDLRDSFVRVVCLRALTTHCFQRLGLLHSIERIGFELGSGGRHACASRIGSFP